MADIAKIQTLHDNTTGEAVAPRTVVKALSGDGAEAIFAVNILTERGKWCYNCVRDWRRCDGG